MNLFNGLFINYNELIVLDYLYLLLASDYLSN